MKVKMPKYYFLGYTYKIDLNLDTTLKSSIKKGYTQCISLRDLACSRETYHNGERLSAPERDLVNWRET